MAEIWSAGARIKYWVDGPADAPALLLAHALGTASALWDPQLPSLVERFRVIRYDARGHGDSSAPDGEYTIDQLGYDALSVLDAAGVKRAHVCGLSLGGLTAIWMGLNAPARVHRLVLANTAARIASAEFWQARIDLIRAEGLASVAAGAPVRWFTEPYRLQHPDQPAKFQQLVLECSPAGYASCAAALRDTDLRPSLPWLDAPSLVITGTHDPVTPPSDAEALVAGIPGAKARVLDAAHFSNVERAADFTDAMIAFLGA